MENILSACMGPYIILNKYNFKDIFKTTSKKTLRVVSFTGHHWMDMIG
jgi:hypothetical protein